TVCAYALNVGAGSQNTTLGCITLTPNAPGNPIGNLDALTPAQGLIRFQGWAGDPNPNPDPFPVRVRVYEDGLQAYSFPADLPRRDVQQAFPDAPQDTGWSYQYGINPNDAISLMCVYALDGPSERLLDCKRR